MPIIKAVHIVNMKYTEQWLVKMLMGQQNTSMIGLDTNRSTQFSDLCSDLFQL